MILTRVAVVAAAIGVLSAGLSGCSSEPESEPEPEAVAVEDFLAGHWDCQSVGGTGAQGTDFRVAYDIDDQRITMEQDGYEATYDYVVTPDGIVTSDSSGGGWQIDGPLEVVEGEDFQASVTSLNGGGTDEQMRLTFEDDGVMVDSFFGYQLLCAKSASVTSTDAAQDQGVEETAVEETASGPACSLVDPSAAVTPAFAEYADSSMYNELNQNKTIADTRCMVPGDAEIIDWYASHGFLIDGISNAGAPFYLATNGDCLLEVAYFADEDNYSPYKMDYPEKLRFGTAAEALEMGFTAKCG